MSAGANPRSRAAKAAQSDAVLHPVVRLGWRPLCDVVCNRLHGTLLGGHDKGSCSLAHQVVGQCLNLHGKLCSATTLAL